MIKSKYAVNKIVGHYLSPLSRYALEPLDGYEDNDTFGIAYNKLYPTVLFEENQVKV